MTTLTPYQAPRQSALLRLKIDWEIRVRAWTTNSNEDPPLPYGSPNPFLRALCEGLFLTQLVSLEVDVRFLTQEG
jgi:hypothetical protein